MERSDFEFDYLKIYFRENYVSKCGIVVRQPTIGDILEHGEKFVYNTLLGPWITNPTQYRLPLWNAGIDWNNVSEFELFCMLLELLKGSDQSLLFPNTDFKGFQLCQRRLDEENSDIVLYDGQVVIAQDDYLEISQYIRIMFNIFPKVEKAKGRATKEAIIWEDEQNLLHKKDDARSSGLLPMVSACINHPGFKYKLSEMKEVGIFEFMDSVQRLQVYESTVALLRGSYSGFCDTSKISKENFNFMRDLKS